MTTGNAWHRTALRLTAGAVTVALTTTGAASAAADPGTASPKVAAAVRADLAGEGRVDAIIMFRERADLRAPAQVAGWGARGRAVVDALRRTAERSQVRVRAELDSRRVRNTPLWAVNAVVVRDADAATIDSISALAEVAAVQPNAVVTLPEPPAGGAAPSGAVTTAAEPVEWGVADIGADRVWSEHGVRGTGVVVANIDTGVQFNHPALAGSYRGNPGSGPVDHNYNWFDAGSHCPSAAPCDDGYRGHGTHTMGTIVGDAGPGNRIGVAPGARWIAAKACRERSCPQDLLLLAGQWMLAPTTLAGTDADPSRRPHVVNSSWGSTIYPEVTPPEHPFLPIVDAWRAAGILPVFSNGNAGPFCGEIGVPGAYRSSLGVGAYDANGTIAPFSSRGPGLEDHTKPNLSAPGVAVRSSIPGNAYDTLNGTSMAAPHVAGAAALVLSAAPGLLGQVDDLETVLESTARQVADLSCGGTAGHNNVYGHGKLDVYAAVTAVRQPQEPVLRRFAAAGSASLHPVTAALGHRTNAIGSIDATGPSPVRTKATGCDAVPRPGDAAAGRLAVRAARGEDVGAGPGVFNGVHVVGCFDVARSAGYPAAVASPTGALTYVPFGVDALTLAAHTGSDLPTSVTYVQAQRIYRCQLTTIAGLSVQPVMLSRDSDIWQRWIQAMGISENDIDLGDYPCLATDHDNSQATPAVAVVPRAADNDGTVLTGGTGRLVPYSAATFATQANAAAVSAATGGTVLDARGPARLLGMRIGTGPLQQPIVDGVANPAFPVHHDVYHVVPTAALADPATAITFAGPDAAVCTAVVADGGAWRAVTAMFGLARRTVTAGPFEAACGSTGLRHDT